ncbi:uncharacterized protein HaLaN_24557, partial [Haematococcus lacustris]
MQIVFCNAGYMVTGFFHSRPLDALLANHSCNATSAVQISHHFLRRMVKPYGIDVLVFFPSPVASRFYDKAHKLDALDFFKRFAVSPDDLPDTVFASIGRTVFRDVGPTAIGFRLVMKLVDYNFFSCMAALFGSQLPDFKRQRLEAQ